MNNRNEAIQRLVNNWNELVECGDFDADEMIESLTEQIDGACQGWDSSLEELDSDPELKDIMGYDEELTDEQANEWLDIVTEAARKYIEGVNK